MPLSRPSVRNIHFYAATNPEVVLGGFRQNGSITEANFLYFLGILLLNPGNTLRVQARVRATLLLVPMSLLLLERTIYIVMVCMHCTRGRN